jgi:hypothetical protein
MASFMDPEDDYLAIVATEEHTALAESKRKKELEQAYTDLKCLSLSYVKPYILLTCEPSIIPCLRRGTRILLSPHNSSLS